MFDDVYIKWYTMLALIDAVLGMVAVVGIILWAVDKKRGKEFSLTSRDITYGAVCLAMAYILSFFGFQLPQGGTVTAAAILPIIIYCYYFGLRKGLVVTTLYMLLQLLTFPYIVSAYSALFDYVMPYMALTLTGVFSYNQKRYNMAIVENKPVIRAHLRVYIGCAIYIVLRYFCHVMSGILFYSEWAWKGYSLLGYSMAYNSFALIDFAVAMAALTALLCSKTFNTFMASNRNALQNANTPAENNQ